VNREFALLDTIMMPLTKRLEDKQSLVESEIEPDAEVIITVAYDNNGYGDCLIAAWGFSCLVKRPQKTILFDTGADGRILLSNMARLGISVDEIDAIVLSHIHGNHTGGLDRFLKCNSRVTVYVPLSFPDQIKQHIKSYGANLLEVHKPGELFAGVFTTGELGDGIREQSLLVDTCKGLVLITGCAHPGVLNIAKRAKEITKDKIYMMVGGFHLAGAFSSQINYIAETLSRLGVEKVAPCHCTGNGAKRLFSNYFGNSYIECGVGKEIVVGGRDGVRLC